MHKAIFGLLSVAAVTLAMPAHGQDVVVGHGRAGVAIGVDHGPDWRYRHRYDHAYGACRTVRERIETPSGRVIIKTRREC